MPVIIRSKRQLAEEIAELIIDREDTEVSEYDLPTMSDQDVYDFLDAWGWEWNESKQAWTW